MVTMSMFDRPALTPVSFLRRSSAVFGDRPAIVDGERTFTYREFGSRCDQLARGLAAIGIVPGDRVAALCANSHPMLELHHSVPMSGAALVPMNTRLSVPELDHILRHSGSRLLVVTKEYREVGRTLGAATGIRIVVTGGDDDTYEALLSADGPLPDAALDERQLLSINYTSGTTGSPKGVMYDHRGAYLQSLAMAYHTELAPTSRYLWTLPMFHCHGWCFPWAVTAAGATHVVVPSVDPGQIWTLLTSPEGISHFSAAPTVLTMIAQCPAARPLSKTVAVGTGGAPPTPTLLRRMGELNFAVTHLYGLTETFGPVAVNQWQPQWDAADEVRRATLLARQGVPNITANEIRVIDEFGRDVASDGRQLGEVVIRGNVVMMGYYRDPDATAQADADGWLRTGDIAVMHPDGYLELRDRRKDIIISGGENISSIEVERVIDAHPDVLESAVVGVADEKWGEVPVAFVTARDGRVLDPVDLAAYLRVRLAHFKVPKRFHTTELPRTSTGKIRKTVLRETAAGLFGGAASDPDPGAQA